MWYSTAKATGWHSRSCERVTTARRSQAGATPLYSAVSVVFAWRRLRWINLVVQDCAHTAVI